MSNIVEKKILVTLCNYAFSKVDTKEFEKWLYSEGIVLEKSLYEHYITLISFSYSKFDDCLLAKREALLIVKKLDKDLYNNQVTEALKELVREIESNFKEVSRAGGISLHQAKVLNNRGTDEEFNLALSLDTDKHWSEIDNITLEKHSDTLFFLDPIGFKYYLPAYINYGLADIDANHRVNDMLYSITDLLLIDCTKDENTNYRTSLFTEEQKKAISHFLMIIILIGNYIDIKAALNAVIKYWKEYLCRK